MSETERVNGIVIILDKLMAMKIYFSREHICVSMNMRAVIVNYRATTITDIFNQFKPT